MDIKVGDIVEYQGHHHRVLKTLTAPNNALRIFGPLGCCTVKKSNISLVKSVTLPTLKVGDTVIVNDVPSVEKHANGVWVTVMDDFIGKTFTIDDLYLPFGKGGRL